MNHYEVKEFIRNNAYMANGRLRPNYLNGHTHIKKIVYDVLSFLPTDTYHNGYVKAYLADLYEYDNVITRLYNENKKPNEISKICKFSRDIVYSTLKHHKLIEGFKLNYVDDEQSVVDMYIAGKSVAEISNVKGTSGVPIRRILKERGYELTGNKLKINKDLVIKSYVEHGNSIEYIAKEFNCSTTSVARILKKSNITIANHLLNVSDINSAIIEYESGVTATYIANKYNISSSTIYQEMDRRNMPRRSSSSYINTNIELIIKDILDECNVAYQKDTRRIIAPYELDYFVEDYNLGIECNGMYWHSSHNTKKDYHYNKFKLCEVHNIQLLQFWCNDILNKRDIITSIIRNKLNMSSKLYARKCIIKDVDGSTARKFINETHVQGYAPSSINKGLYYNDELVMIMTVGKSRFDKGAFELIRVSTKLDTVVVGGFSKLLKSIEIKNIISYCNLMYGNGNVYLKNNFEYIKDTSVGYFYHKQSKTVSRYKVASENFKTSIQYDNSINEYNNMLNNGYYKCYDAGNRKYILKR